MLMKSPTIRITGKYALGACIVCVLAGAARFSSSMFALQGFSLSQYSVVAGGAITGTATLTQTSPAVTVISFTSNNATAAAVQTGMPVSPGSNRAVVPIRGLAAGCADITATHAGTTRIQQMVVHPVPGTTAFNLLVPNSLLFHGSQPATGTVSDAGAMLSTQSVALSSSNTSVVTVPASRALVRGRASFPITIVGEGCALITARIGTQSITKTVRAYWLPG